MREKMNGGEKCKEKESVKSEGKDGKYSNRKGMEDRKIISKHTRR